MGTPPFEQPDTAENITFPQARYADGSKCLTRKMGLVYATLQRCLSWHCGTLFYASIISSGLPPIVCVSYRFQHQQVYIYRSMISFTFSLHGFYTVLALTANQQMLQQ